MKITGTSTLSADREAVYRALNDPAVLVATIPGCRRLEALGDDAYAMTVAAGVGSITGVYDGEVRLTDHVEPDRFTLKAHGSGAPGTIGADVAVSLVDGDDGGTVLTYEADAVVGGMIGGVGQRMLTGVSRKMADEFFRNVDAVLSGARPLVAAGGPAGAARTDASGAAVDGSGGRPEGPDGFAAPGASGRAAPGTVFEAPGAAAAGAGGPGFATGVAVGAAAALLGAVVGGWIASRRRG